MRIDFIISALRGGGAERVLIALSEHFVKKGHEISIITYNRVEDQYNLDPQIERLHLNKKLFPVIKVSNLLNLLFHYRKNEHRPDVIISFLSLNNLISILIGRLYGIPVIVSEHHNHRHVENPKWLTRLTWKYIYRKAKYVTVLTHNDVSFFENYKCNVVVMPNPCSFEVIPNLNSAREKTIMAIGKLNRYHHKGFDNLIKLIAPVLKQNQDWQLKIVGDGNEGLHYLSGLASQFKISKQIDFTGFRNDVRELLSKSSIFVLPSRYEGLPMVLLEAMSQGATCIAYDCFTGPAEIIEDNVNGLLIADQDQNAMQEGLKKLIENNDLRQELAQNGLRSLDKYSIDNIYQRWSKLFNSIQE